MRALRKTARGPGAELMEVPVPAPRDDEVLVRVHGASICGTDLHIYDWNEWAEGRVRDVPMTFGHEMAGTVEAVGDEVHHLQPGAFVAAETHIACGHCATCQTGRAHICENLRILGVDMDGAFAEYVVLPAQNAWVVGEGIDPDVASIMEPFGNAVHAAFGTGGGEDIATNAVAVIGCGPIGMFAVGDRAVAGRVQGDRDRAQRLPPREGGGDGRRRGDRPDRRSTRSQAVLGAHERRSGAEVVLEMSGNARAIDQGTRLLARGGRMSLLGLPDGPVDAGPQRPGHLQGGAAAGHHGPRDVPDVAADDDAAVHRPGRRVAGDHAPVPAGAVRGGVRHHGVGRRARSSCCPEGRPLLPTPGGAA